ncbi:MAG: hypothetical protein KGL95_00640 [Patescibacteria group bacterium]|nr:hypothetical protein [Patescibacteria group bacterium]
MIRLPQEETVAMIESMRRDLDHAYMQVKELTPGTNEYLVYVFKVRTLADEIIRWTLL